MFFGPVYLTLQIGALGALTLGAMTGAILALERRRDFLAGTLLSLALLKPSQGLPILLLGGIWLIFRRSWKAILGMAVGALGLLLLGFLLDPAWPVVFLGSAQGLMTRNVGLHSNVFSLASHACASGGACTWLLGGVASLIVAGATLLYLWRRRRALTQVEAFSLIFPIAFILAIYAWSYDQILYVIPIAWIAAQLAVSRRGYRVGSGLHPCRSSLFHRRLGGPCLHGNRRVEQYHVSPGSCGSRSRTENTAGRSNLSSVVGERTTAHP